MVVRIRLARCGGRHNPHYRINVANSFNKRDGRHIERLGNYSPIPDKNGCKTVQLNFDRVKYWLGVGAQPTETVSSLLYMAGLLPPKPRLIKWKEGSGSGSRETKKEAALEEGINKVE